METKRCPRCDNTLLLDAFSFSRKGKPLSYCKECVRLLSREYHNGNRTVVLERARKRYQERMERGRTQGSEPTSEDTIKQCRVCGATKAISEYYRRTSGELIPECKECVKVHAAEWAAANPEKHKLTKRAYYWRHERGRYAEAQRRYRERNLERCRENNRRWAVENRERVNESNRAGRVVLRAIERGELTRPTCCQECGREIYVEAAHGDYGRPLDVRWLCRVCHRRWDAAEPKTRKQEETPRETPERTRS